MNPVTEFIDRVIADLNSGMLTNPNEDNVVMVPAYEAIHILQDIRQVALGAKVAEPTTRLHCSKCGDRIGDDMLDKSSIVEHWKRKHNLGGL